VISILADAGSSLSPATVGTIIGAVVVALLGGGVLGKKTGKAEGKAEAMLIGPQPFMVELKQDFVTRREFEKLEGRLETSVTEMKGLFRETMSEMKCQTNLTLKKMDGQNERLTKKIEEVAGGAYGGRQKLWETLNPLRVEVGALQATSDVAGQLGKLAAAITPPPTKVQPTHQS